VEDKKSTQYVTHMQQDSNIMSH